MAMCFFKAQGIQGTLLQGAETSIAADDIGLKRGWLASTQNFSGPTPLRTSRSLSEVEKSRGLLVWGVSEFRIHSYPEVI